MSTEQNLRADATTLLGMGREQIAKMLTDATDELVTKDRQIASLQTALTDLERVLRQKGFAPCDIPACNCGSWHHRYGLPERWQEIQDALAEAGVLDNSTGNMPIKAVEKLVGQRESLTAEVERLRALVEDMADCLDSENLFGRANHFRKQAESQP